MLSRISVSVSMPIVIFAFHLPFVNPVVIENGLGPFVLPMDEKVKNNFIGLPYRSRLGLLHRYGFGEIAGLVHVAAAPHGNVIRQKLQRDDLQDRRQ